METILTYRGLPITEPDVARIVELIGSQPKASRRSLSQKVCEAFGWVQPNGQLRDGVCRGLLLALDRAGHIALPAPRWVAGGPAARHQSPRPIEVDRSPLVASLAELGPLSFGAVRGTADEALFEGLIEAHHYLGYTRPVGEHLKYLVFGAARPLACFAWSSAPRHLGPRDRFIGWSAESRRRNIRLVAYNSRFLILPWVRVPHLASHLLGRMAATLPGEWERMYGHPVWFAETFVEPARFRGTCYRAANWVWLGRTTGRGNNAPTKRPSRPLKDVFGLPLRRGFRRLLETLS